MTETSLPAASTRFAGQQQLFHPAVLVCIEFFLFVFVYFLSVVDIGEDGGVCGRVVDQGLD